MSGARFARSGRARFFICFVALMLMLGMVAIFHNTTRQLDKTREKHLACEQQQEKLNEQLQSIVEEKYTLQKNYKNELDEQMQTRQDLEQKVKKLNEQVVKEQSDNRMQNYKLQQAQSEHKEFIKECTKSKQQLLADGNELNRKIKELRSKELQEQSALSSELAMWQEKYNKIVNEKERLEKLLNLEENENRIVELEYIVADYRVHCDYEPKAALGRLLAKKPLDIPHIKRKSSSQTPKLYDTSKSFNQQVRLEDGRYHINIFTQQQNTNNSNKTNNLISITTTTTAALNNSASYLNGVGGIDQEPAGVSVSDHPAAIVPETIPVETALLSFAQRNNGSLILNSVENFQIAPQLNKKLDEEKINKMVPPLGAPHKLTSTAASKVQQKQEMANLQMATNKTSRAVKLTVSSTSNMPPLQLPPQLKQQSQKLPDYFAPIPEHFEDFSKNEEQQQSFKETNTHDNKNVVETQGDAAVAETQNSESQKKINIQSANGDDNNNNRYSNVVKDINGIASKDFKENESYVNEQNFNVPNNEDENNFFDTVDDTKKNLAGQDFPAVGGGVINKADGNNAADDSLGNGNETAEDVAADIGDIEVKQNKNSLNVDNVNKEVAGDQGKEFDEGLHLEEGMEEDADEDEYSHLRQRGEEAIRN